MKTCLRRGALAAALLLPLAAAADCGEGLTPVGLAVANGGAGAVVAAARQAASGQDWSTVELPAGAQGSLDLCLEMILSVGSAEYTVADGAGAMTCSGSALLPQGAAATLEIAADGTCGLKVDQ